jgi:hypothetical protein
LFAPMQASWLKNVRGDRLRPSDLTCSGGWYPRWAAE